MIERLSIRVTVPAVKADFLLHSDSELKLFWKEKIEGWIQAKIEFTLTDSKTCRPIMSAKDGKLTIF